MRKRSWLCAIVEHWNPHAKIRQDLFGIIDLLCVKQNSGTIGIQTTSYSNMSARVNKIQTHETLPLLLGSGWNVEVHGWKKNKDGHWACRVWEARWDRYYIDGN